MLNNNDFTNLERRLWREGNPLTDELTSTRDTLLSLIKEAQTVVSKYSPAINKSSTPEALDYFHEWDTFGDTLDNLTRELEA